VQDHAADALLLSRVKVVNDLSVELAVLEGVETGALVSMTTTWALIPSVPSYRSFDVPHGKPPAPSLNVLRLRCIGGFNFIHRVLSLVLLDQERVTLLSPPD
jgi:hypothetical protein